MGYEIRAVLFDFGGVFTPSPFDAVERAGERLGAAPGQLHEIMFGSYHEDTDHPWHRLERGELPIGHARDAIIEMGRAQGLEFDPFLVLGGSGTGKAIRTAFIECARDLMQRGYTTGMLTNNVREFGRAWRRMIPVEEIFHHVVDSSEVGLRKPDPAIYRLAVETIGIEDPAEVVFLDDLESNVDAAREVGLRGVVVGEEWQEAIDELEALLR